MAISSTDQWKVSLNPKYRAAAEKLKKRNSEFTHLNSIAVFAIDRYLRENGIDPESSPPKQTSS